MSWKFISESVPKREMANFQKPWKAEYAKSSRSLCRTCRMLIHKETLRLGKSIQSFQFDGFMHMWNHAHCVLSKGWQINFLEDVDGFESLRWEDQQNIRKYVEEGVRYKTVVDCGVDIPYTSRAICRHCRQKITDGEIRIWKKPEGKGAKGLAWHHANCFLEMSPTFEVEKLSGWHSLSGSDQNTLLSLVKKVPLTSIGKKAEQKELTSKWGAKRKRTAGSCHKSKLARTGENCFSSNRIFERNTHNLNDNQPKETDLESQLEMQTRTLWALKDELKRNVTTSELRKMLEANDQDTLGSELDLRDRCADGMLFGALAGCPLCSGCLSYSSGVYRCHGYTSAWSKCSYSTIEPQRVKGKWKIPEEINEYLLKWFKSQKAKKPKRVLPPCSSLGVSRSQPGHLAQLYDLHETDSYLAGQSMVTVTVKGRSAVHPCSGLQHSGHILEEGNSTYNTTLNLSDLSTGVNSYYILQIIRKDEGSACYVFRQWGRVGSEMIGGSKRTKMSEADAINEFKHLFLQKTGNSWEAWERRKNFEKQPGKFYPLEIDYEVNKNAVPKKKFDKAGSKLAPEVVRLMKMLFNVETYRQAMMKFEINLSEMPLGKLSKSNIQKGFVALTEIQNLLNSNTHDPSVKESLLVDASNRFFTVIPTIHPHVIRDENQFKSKLKILEALEDIEIASRLVGFDGDDEDSIDDKYEKLHCHINPLPRDSEDYKLIEKYLHTTHAPTHTEWALELEEVFSLEREGELDRYAPYRKNLKNRMLLWHGSRLTNFVGILSEGLRIAPPQAPKSGYMFGKGIYFADLVSKSAQYCYTDPENPIGLMLLSEVALGEVHELTKAEYMEKPPQGKDSTKGLGQKMPRQSDYVKWGDDMVVPCGKPVSSRIKATELMYNEYIVYNTAQVKLQFLLKVRFRHKKRWWQ